MSSSETGTRKRFKDKKRKKGSVGESSLPSNLQQDKSHKKIVLDETIHVQKDVHFGGNILSKLIFVLILLLLGISLMYMLSQNDVHEVSDSPGITSWLVNLISSNYFWSKEKEQSLTEHNVDIEPEEISQFTYWDYLFPFWSFIQKTYEEPESVEKDFLPNVENGGDSENMEQFERKADEENDETVPEDHDDSNEQKDDEDDRNLENDPDDSREDDRNDSGDDDDDDDSGEPENRGFSYQSSHNSYKFETYKYNTEDETYKEDDLEEKYYNSDDMNESSEEKDDENTRYGRNNEADDTDDDEPKENEENDEYPAEDDVPQNYDALNENDNEESQDSSEEEEDTLWKDEGEPDNEPANEENLESSNAITKLGVGVALIFVAYTVIIRKWNNYVGDELIDNVPVVETTHSQQSHIFEDDEGKNETETAQDFSETPSVSESEDEQEYSPGTKMPADEVEDTESYTGTSGSDLNDSDIEPRYTSSYGKANITNEYDWRYRDDLDDADEDFDRGKLDIAAKKYEEVLRIAEHSARAKYGIARVLDRKAEILKSNKVLANAIAAYEDLLRTQNVTDSLLKNVTDRVINRLRFKGEYARIIPIQELMIERFPVDVSYRNDLVVTLLMLNRMSEAEMKLEEILRKWPNDGMALVHYGFVLKLKGNLTSAVKFLEKGIKTEEPGTQDGRFYFHLGDALQKLKRDTEAMLVYEQGVIKGVFLSKYQRSLYNINRLTARPWWSLEQSTYSSFFKTLETNWKIIRDEVLQVLNNKNESSFREEAEQLREVGDWRQLELFSRGQMSPQCEKVPFTCRTVSNFRPAAHCRRGQVKFSIMEPGTHVWPHCGPTNCRLRAHLGLIIPSNVSIRVADETKTWKEGEILIFDDSFEHEVWHNGTAHRLILIVDVWHPELTEYERKSLNPI